MTSLPLNLSSAKLLLLGLITLCAVAPISAQTFVGSDNFDSGYSSANWDYSYRLNSATQGVLSFTNSQIEFSKAAAGIGNQTYLWNSDGTANANVTATSFTTSWVTTISVTNTLSGLSGAEFGTMGLTFFNDDGEYYALMLSATSTGNWIRAEGNGFSAVNLTTGDNTDVLLRVSWDAGANLLSSAFSTDGSSFTSVNSFNPVSGWSNATYPVSNGFNFGVFGNSDTPTGIAVGVMHADNFSVSAVPEPSTYAAIFGGLMLGFAAWKRRRNSAV